MLCATSHYPYWFKKRIVVEFEWGLAMIEHNLYFKFDAIEETLIKLIRFNFSAFKKVTCGSNRTDNRKALALTITSLKPHSKNHNKDNQEHTVDLCSRCYFPD